jgi:WD40 repeat protein
LGAPLHHQSTVRSAALSLDGTTLLTGCADNTARLWDTLTGKPLSPPLQHQDMVYAVALSSDGKLALTGSHDKTARLWEVPSGRPIGPPLQHPDHVDAVAISPDGTTVLTGCDDGIARLWDVLRPIEGDPERITLWAEVLTGLEVDAAGNVHTLDVETWQKRMQKLDKPD